MWSMWTGPDKQPGSAALPQTESLPGELLRAIPVITSYATKLALPTLSVLLRLDGLYGDAAPLIDVLTASLGVIARSRDYSLLDLEVVKQALARSPDQVSTHPESGMTRALYDCKTIPLTLTGPSVRLVVATHAVTSSPPKIGVERDGMVYELFVSTLPSPAFTASDVLDLASSIADRLRRCSLLKMTSKTRIVGTLVPRAARSCAKSWHNGCGTCAWNWGKSSPRRSCARRNLPKPW